MKNTHCYGENWKKVSRVARPLHDASVQYCVHSNPFLLCVGQDTRGCNDKKKDIRDYSLIDQKFSH